jgi:tRNA(Ile)-lysidine synthase
MDLEGTVRRVVREEGLIEPGDKVLVAVSGGIDSSSLLFLLDRIKEEIPMTLGVVHVNHGLRGPESERDEAFVRALAEKLSLECHVLRADVHAEARAAGLSTQHAGRNIRYRFFEEVSEREGYRKIAIAHNRDDQVETFLLRVIKGTGLNGLTSIPIRRGRIVRPFLRTYRSEIEDYARSSSISFVEDSSNKKETYERNFLRINIMPLMTRINPRFREKVLLLLSDITSVDGFFENEATRFLGGPTGGTSHQGDVEESIPVAAFRALHPETRFRVVSRLLARLEPRFIALREHVKLVEKSLSSARPNNRVVLPHGIEVRRAYDSLVFTRRVPETEVRDIVEIGPGRNHVPSLGIDMEVSSSVMRPRTLRTDGTTAYFDADAVSTLSLRSFRNGDRFTPLGMAESVKLKDYFMARKIPAARRRKIPLLLSGDDIMWVVGERIDERYKVTQHTRSFLRIEFETLACPKTP